MCVCGNGVWQVFGGNLAREADSGWLRPVFPLTLSLSWIFNLIGTNCVFWLWRLMPLLGLCDDSSAGSSDDQCGSRTAKIDVLFVS